MTPLLYGLSILPLLMLSAVTAKVIGTVVIQTLNYLPFPYETWCDEVVVKRAFNRQSSSHFGQGGDHTPEIHVPEVGFGARWLEFALLPDSTAVSAAASKRTWNVAHYWVAYYTFKHTWGGII